jgi:hypothetical protein
MSNRRVPLSSALMHRPVASQYVSAIANCLLLVSAVLNMARPLPIDPRYPGG